MSSVFKSQEVYKKLNKELHNKNEIIPVRGVYVSGEYKPPYYSESGLRITEIYSNKPMVVDFKTENVDTSETDTVGILSFNSSSNIDIVVYDVDKKSSDDQDTVGLLSFSINRDLSIYVFGKDYFDNDTDSVGLLSFEFNPQLNIATYNKNYRNSTPEPILRLTTLSTQQATVENVIF